VVNDQLVRPLVVWNFGPDAPVPHWDIEVKVGEDLQAALTIVSGAQRLGKKITAGYVSERFEIPLAKGEDGENPDDILAPNISAPSVALRDTTSTSFSERGQELLRAEMEQYDKMFAQMQAEGEQIFKRRIKQIVATAVPPREE
jgi:phage gp29-like protein